MQSLAAFNTEAPRTSSLIEQLHAAETSKHLSSIVFDIADRLETSKLIVSTSYNNLFEDFSELRINTLSSHAITMKATALLDTATKQFDLLFPIQS